MDDKQKLAKRERKTGLAGKLRQPVRVVHVTGGLTFAEQNVLRYLGLAQDAYTDMDGLLAHDADDFLRLIRTLERHVMARVAQRGVEEIGA